MSPQKPSFLKRDRERKLQDRAKQKAERREARKNNPNAGHGPPIGTDDNTYPDDPAPPAVVDATPPADPPKPE